MGAYLWLLENQRENDMWENILVEIGGGQYTVISYVPNPNALPYAHTP